MPPVPVNYQLILKLGIVAVTIIGIFVLAALGRLDAKDSLQDIVIVVGGLTVALGISGGLANGAAQLVRGQSIETGPALVLMPSKAPPAPSPMFPAGSNRPPGYVLAKLLPAVALLGVLVFGIGATCTKEQIVKDVTIGLQAAACVLITVATDEQGGKDEATALESAAVTCGVSAAQAAGILGAHRRAMTLDAMPRKALASDAGK